MHPNDSREFTTGEAGGVGCVLVVHRTGKRAAESGGVLVVHRMGKRAAESSSLGTVRRREGGGGDG